MNKRLKTWKKQDTKKRIETINNSLDNHQENLGTIEKADTNVGSLS
jgi:hypothetical protein